MFIFICVLSICLVWNIPDIQVFGHSAWNTSYFCFLGVRPTAEQLLLMLCFLQVFGQSALNTSCFYSGFFFQVFGQKSEDLFFLFVFYIFRCSDKSPKTSSYCQFFFKHSSNPPGTPLIIVPIFLYFKIFVKNYFFFFLFSRLSANKVALPSLPQPLNFTHSQICMSRRHRLSDVMMTLSGVELR